MIAFDLMKIGRQVEALLAKGASQEMAWLIPGEMRGVPFYFDEHVADEQVGPPLRKTGVQGGVLTPCIWNNQI